MAKNSFKAKNSLNLEPQTRPTSPDFGDMYFDVVSNTAMRYNGYWIADDTQVDIAVQASFTSTTLTSSYSENAVITITGTPGAPFNLHGLARNSNGKMITIFNNTDQKMVVLNNSATELVVANRLTTPSGNNLSIAKHTACNVFYEASTLKWIACPSGSGGGGTSFDAIQAAHGFSLLTPIYHNGTTWVKAMANQSTTLAMYIVTDVSTNSFTAAKFGAVEVTSHGLTVGEYYYVSSSVLGGIITTEPLFGFSNPVLYVVDANNIHAMCYRPNIIGDGNVSDSEIGAVIAFPFITEPAGFLYCDGRTVSRTTYAELYSSIGISHGIGDGSTTFNLPDYRGRFLRGVDGIAGNDPDVLARTSTNGGNSGNSAGSVQGDGYGTHTHIQNAHTHIQDAHTHIQDAHNHTQSAHGHNFTVSSDSGVVAIGTFAASTSSAGSQSTNSSITSAQPAIQNSTATNQNTAATNQNTTATNQNTGNSETRPKNINVGYFIRFAARGAIAGDKVPAGTVNAFAGAAAAVPSGYILCNGASVLRADYPTLFSVVGVSWGTVDSTHFNLPDFRGGFLRGLDGTAGRDTDVATRIALALGGATGNNVGSYQSDVFGSHTHTQNAHSHNITDPGHTHINEDGTNGGSTGPSISKVLRLSGTGFVDTQSGVTCNSIGMTNVTTSVTINNSTATNQNTGNSETRPKNMAVNFIIKY
jgi:microcystin-dependent protein